MVLKGKNHSEETKKKISKANKGRKLSERTEEHRRKLSEMAKCRNNPMYGKHLSK